MAAGADAPAAGRSSRAARRHGLSAVFWRRPWLRAAALLAAPLAWLVFIYLAALASLFVSAFWGLDAFTGKVVHTWDFDNFDTILARLDLLADRAPDDRDRGAR